MKKRTTSVRARQSNVTADKAPVTFLRESCSHALVVGLFGLFIVTRMQEDGHALLLLFLLSCFHKHSMQPVLLIPNSLL